MKKIVLFATAALFAAFVSATAFAGDDRTISFDKLPEKAQQFIKQHFGDKVVSSVRQDTDWLGGDYDVRFVDGAEISFRHNGEWDDVECKDSQVPAAIVPEKIASYVTEKYPDSRIVEIDRDLRGYEIELSNDVKLKFDRKGEFTSIDK